MCMLSKRDLRDVLMKYKDLINERILALDKMKKRAEVAEKCFYEEQQEHMQTIDELTQAWKNCDREGKRAELAEAELLRMREQLRLSEESRLRVAEDARERMDELHARAMLAIDPRLR